MLKINRKISSGKYLLLLGFLLVATWANADSKVDVNISASKLGSKDVKPEGSGVAVINMQYIFENSIAVKGLRQKIADISNDLQNQVAQQKKALKQEEDELVNLRAKSESPEYKAKLDSFSSKINNLQQKFQQKKIALEKAHSKAMAKVHEKIYYIIKEYADSDNFNIVISGDNVMFVRNKYDLTKRVLEKLDQEMQIVDFNYKED